MSNKKVVEALKVSLADSYTLYLKTQNYHWNVTGPQFKGLHTLFEEQYTELAGAVDELAERIRALGEKAPGSYREFSKLATIKEAAGTEDAKTMVTTLKSDHLKLAQTLTKAIQAAQNAEDEGTVDMLGGRIAAHQKQAWMLEATAA